MTETVKVVLRVRPLLEHEKGNISIVKTQDSEIHIQSENAGIGKTYTFDSVYGIDSLQQTIYDETAFPLVENVLEGYNGTIFAYGQTGCGKTFTMTGDPENSEKRGVIPNSFLHIFEAITDADKDKTFLVCCSYCEIYKEEFRDLLNPKNPAKLELHDNTDGVTYVRGLTKSVVKSVSDIDRYMAFGSSQRVTKATAMNSTSSRSHAIFTIYVEISEEEEGQQKIRAGKLNLVDLAGSERQKKTHAAGERLKEAIEINLSLSSLGNVISALVDGNIKHIPYRDSKLTRILKDSLGGNTKTIMIACISPASYNYEESLSTLRYASRAKFIQNKPHINEDPKDALLRQYVDEINRLKSLLSQSEAGDPIVVEKIVEKRVTVKGPTRYIQVSASESDEEYSDDEKAKTKPKVKRIRAQKQESSEEEYSSEEEADSTFQDKVQRNSKKQQPRVNPSQKAEVESKQARATPGAQPRMQNKNSNASVRRSALPGNATESKNQKQPGTTKSTGQVKRASPGTIATVPVKGKGAAAKSDEYDETYGIEEAKNSGSRGTKAAPAKRTQAKTQANFKVAGEAEDNYSDDFSEQDSSSPKKVQKSPPKTAVQPNSHQRSIKANVKEARSQNRLSKPKPTAQDNYSDDFSDEEPPKAAQTAQQSSNKKQIQPKKLARATADSKSTNQITKSTKIIEEDYSDDFSADEDLGKSNPSKNTKSPVKRLQNQKQPSSSTAKQEEEDEYSDDFSDHEETKKSPGVKKVTNPTLAANQKPQQRSPAKSPQPKTSHKPQNPSMGKPQSSKDLNSPQKSGSKTAVAGVDRLKPGDKPISKTPTVGGIGDLESDDSAEESPNYLKTKAKTQAKTIVQPKTDVRNREEAPPESSHPRVNTEKGRATKLVQNQTEKTMPRKTTQRAKKPQAMPDEEPRDALDLANAPKNPDSDVFERADEAVNMDFAATADKDQLDQLIADIQNRVHKGGENLMNNDKKAVKEQRERRLKLRNKKSKQALQLQKRREEQEAALMEKCEFGSLEEEAEESRNIIAKLRQRCQGAVSEIDDLQKEHEENREDILGNLRNQEHEINFYIQVVNSIFSQAEQKKIRNRAVFDSRNSKWMTPSFELDKKVTKALPTMTAAPVRFNVDKKKTNMLDYGAQLTTNDLMHMPVTDEFAMPGDPEYEEAKVRTTGNMKKIDSLREMTPNDHKYVRKTAGTSHRKRMK